MDKVKRACRTSMEARAVQSGYRVSMIELEVVRYIMLCMKEEVDILVGYFEALVVVLEIASRVDTTPPARQMTTDRDHETK